MSEVFWIHVHVQEYVYILYRSTHAHVPADCVLEVDGFTVNSPGLVWAWTAETRINTYKTLYAQTHARMKEAKLLSDELSTGFWNNVKCFGTM